MLLKIFYLAKVAKTTERVVDRNVVWRLKEKEDNLQIVPFISCEETLFIVKRQKSELFAGASNGVSFHTEMQYPQV